MTDLRQLQAESRRICILRTLAEAPGYRSNDSMLHTIVDTFGLPCSRDQIRGDITWLQEQGLVSLQEIVDVYVVQVTERGLDVATGRITAPGVKRPSPR